MRLKAPDGHVGASRVLDEDQRHVFHDVSSSRAMWQNLSGSSLI